MTASLSLHHPGLRARQARRHDALTPGQRRTLVALVAAAHVAAAWALLQVREVREVVTQAAPIFVSWVSPPPREPVPPVAAPPVPKTPPPPPKRHVIAAEPTPEPVPFTAPPAPPEPVAPPPAPAAPPATPVQAAAPAPVAEPRQIPASAVQYIVPPELVYPRASRRAGESGRTVLRVFIDEAGLPRQVTVSQSSGFPRLDEAATAAVRKARFKPYSDNGQPVAGWALIPLSFDLEK